MNIYQRLQAVMRQVTYVQKDANVKAGGGSYKAVTHDMVTALVRPHFVEHGIVLVPRLGSSAVVDTGRKTSNDNPIIRFEGLYEVSFVNVDDPTESVTVPVASHAEDQGDKSPGKALSYAVKYAILKVLMLETGESDESRFAQEMPMTAALLVQFHDKIMAAGAIEPLRVILAECMTVAAEAGDHSAHEKIKAWGVKRAADFGASAPERAPVAEKKKAPEKEADVDRAADAQIAAGTDPLTNAMQFADTPAPTNGTAPKPAPASMLRLLRAKAASLGIEESKLLAVNELETLDGISIALGNHIMATLAPEAYK